jgi:hypothetical protein
MASNNDAVTWLCAARVAGGERATRMSQTTTISDRDEYLRHFGEILQCFAEYEAVMQEIMAAVSGADLTSIRLLTMGLNFTDKRDALFNLLRHRAVPIDRVEHVRNYLQMPRTYTALRNDIAHSIWADTEPRNAIRPLWATHGPLKAVKPVHDIGKGQKEFIEDYEDRVAYTLDDLREIAANLTRDCAQFRAYVTSVGLGSRDPA